MRRRRAWSLGDPYTVSEQRLVLLIVVGFALFAGGLIFGAILSSGGWS